MQRREFITLLGGAAAAWPLVARAQQTTAPVIGYLSGWAAEASQKLTQAFRQGLNEAGFVEGRNVTIEYRFAEGGQSDQLSMMAADLIGRSVTVLFASPIAAALAAKAVTATTPIVFAIGSDPIEMGLVESMGRPGRNATGATFLSVELGAKRLELLHELVPKIASVGLLVNPNNPTSTMQTKDMQVATTALGLRLDIMSARSQSDFDSVFATLVRQRTDALVVSPDPVFLSHRDQLVALAMRHSMPTIYFSREFAVAGGLISYATSFADSFREAAAYVGRILKGEKVADLPVLQPTKFELVINLKTAKVLGLEVPLFMQQRADEIIE
jgi:putative tryptophan/tyrosine transport system substrate-binding protein